jgi:S1-C subfamily serine protease
VIGVNSQIVSPVRGSAGIGFAVSSNTVLRVVPQLIVHGRYPHPWLGVSVLPFDAEGARLLREAGMDVPVDEGLLVAEVVPNGPAAVAGIRSGDRVVRIGNAEIPLGGDIITAINSKAHSQLPGVDRLLGNRDTGGGHGGDDSYPEQPGDESVRDASRAARTVLMGRRKGRYLPVTAPTNNSR